MTDSSQFSFFHSNSNKVDKRLSRSIDQITYSVYPNVYCRHIFLKGSYFYRAEFLHMFQNFHHNPWLYLVSRCYCSWSLANLCHSQLHHHWFLYSIRNQNSPWHWAEHWNPEFLACFDLLWTRMDKWTQMYKKSHITLVIYWDMNLYRGDSISVLTIGPMMHIGPQQI